MTYESLVKVNNEIKTTDIKGKDYAEVNERINAFRKLYPNGSIRTEIVSLDNGVVVIKATVFDDSGKWLGTGHAYEKENSTFINKTSYIENAETSAVGRALGMLGIGISTSVASYEEVANAIKQQEDNAKPEKKEETAKPEKKAKKVLSEADKNARNEFVALCKKYNLKTVEVAKKYNLTNDSNADDFKKAIESITVDEEVKGIEEMLNAQDMATGVIE